MHALSHFNSKLFKNYECDKTDLVKIFNFVCVYVCVCLIVWGIWHDHILVEAGREDLFPRDWSSCGCKLLDVDAGSQTQVLRKSSTYSQLLSCPSSLGLIFLRQVFAVYLSRLFNSLHCLECTQTTVVLLPLALCVMRLQAMSHVWLSYVYVRIMVCVEHRHSRGQRITSDVDLVCSADVRLVGLWDPGSSTVSTSYLIWEQEL